MKKVKIMLSAILVMAGVAGAVAFTTAKKANTCLFTYKASPTPAACVLAGNAKITAIGFGATTLGTIVDKGSFANCNQVPVPAVAQCNQQIRTTVE